MYLQCGLKIAGPFSYHPQREPELRRSCSTFNMLLSDVLTIFTPIFAALLAFVVVLAAVDGETVVKVEMPHV